MCDVRGRQRKIERGVDIDEYSEGIERERVRKRGGWVRERVCESVGGR